ncbi:MAG TPA: hypothetical protein ENN07_04700 [candidate division Zixibacteria bacterium]|nr:hypothetical protein [candidate division Zixibacteria bacterium]
MKILALILIPLALLGAWVEISRDSAQAFIEPDSSEITPFDSIAVTNADTSKIGQVRPSERLYFQGSAPVLLEIVGYCYSPDSTRTFFAICPEKGRWFVWQEQ